MPPKPIDVAVQRLLELKVIEQKNGKYTYSTEFEKTAEELKKNPPGMFDSMKLAKDVDFNVSPVLIAYARFFKSQHEVKNLATAYVMLTKHLKRLNMKTNIDSDILYGVYYFNDNELDVV